MGPSEQISRGFGLGYLLKSAGGGAPIQSSESAAVGKGISESEDLLMTMLGDKILRELMRGDGSKRLQDLVEATDIEYCQIVSTSKFLQRKDLVEWREKDKHGNDLIAITPSGIRLVNQLPLK